jgi:hypothetical protein
MGIEFNHNAFLEIITFLDFCTTFVTKTKIQSGKMFHGFWSAKNNISFFLTIRFSSQLSLLHLRSPVPVFIAGIKLPFLCVIKAHVKKIKMQASFPKPNAGFPALLI